MRPGKTRVFVLAAALCFPAQPAAAVDATDDVLEPLAVREHRIKAAFLYNFARFVEWPEQAFDNDNAPFVIGLLGRDRLAAALEALEGKPVAGRQVQIVRFGDVDEVDRCQLLFVDPSDTAQVTAILAALKGKSILTVGEIEDFAKLGGVIGFTVRKNKVGFEINHAAGARAGLTISSRLLKLAKIVAGDPETTGS